MALPYDLFPQMADQDVGYEDFLSRALPQAGYGVMAPGVPYGKQTYLPTLRNMKADPFGGLRQEINDRVVERRLGDLPATLDALRYGTVANPKIDLQAAQAAAKRQQAIDALKYRRAKLGANVGTFQNPAAAIDQASALADSAVRAASGQKVDPRWGLGGVSVGGMGLPSPAASPRPMDRSALAARLAELSKSNYVDGTQLLGNRTQVTVRPDGRIALVGAAARLPELRERFVSAPDAPTVKDRLNAARARRVAANPMRLLSSKNAAIRERGANMLAGDDGVDTVEGIIQKAQQIGAKYGPAVAKYYAESANQRLQNKAEMDFRSKESDKTLATQREIAGVRAGVDKPLTKWEQEAYMEKVFPHLSTDPVARAMKMREIFGDGVNAGLGPVLSPPSGSALPSLKPNVPSAPFGNRDGSGVVVNEPYQRPSSAGSDLLWFLTEYMPLMRGVPLVRY